MEKLRHLLTLIVHPAPQTMFLAQGKKERILPLMKKNGLREREKVMNGKRSVMRGNDVRGNESATS